MVSVVIVLSTKDDNNGPVVPTNLVAVRFTAAGDVADYTVAVKDSMLLALAVAAGFTTTPAGSSLNVNAGSVIVTASLAVSNDAAARATSATLQSALQTQALLQTVLSATGVTVESAPTLRTVAADGMPLRGTWLTNYGSYVTVSPTTWISMSSWSNSYQIINTWNATSLAKQNEADASYNPSKWVRSEYHLLPDGTAAFCDIIYDAQTEAEALNADVTGQVVRENATTNGCGGSFAHTLMSPYNIPVAGSWVDNYGTPITITNHLWEVAASWGYSNYTILAYGANFAIAQNGPDNSYNAGKFSRFDYHDISSSGFEWCQSVYNADTARLALKPTGPTGYSAANKTHGCGGSFAHSTATRGRRHA